VEPIVIGRGVEIPESELEMTFSRSGGPGGQHVNKTETRVTLRFDVANSPSLPEHIREKLLARLASRLTNDGELLVSADRHRERPKNQSEARRRLKAIMDAALVEQKKRTKTRPGKGAKRRRLADKKKNAEKKAMRKPPKMSD
jgi:ribosome-associated protein